MASPLNNPANTAAKWQAAADAAKAVIDMNLYSLFADYKSLFLLANSYNSEVIWSRPYNYTLSSEEAYLELSNIQMVIVDMVRFTLTRIWWIVMKC